MNLRLHNFYFIAVLIATVLCMATFDLSAQETVSNTQVSKKTIEARMDEVQADATLDEEFRSLLIESYKAALAQIESTKINLIKAEACRLTLLKTKFHQQDGGTNSARDTLLRAVMMLLMSASRFKSQERKTVIHRGLTVHSVDCVTRMNHQTLIN